MISAVFRGGIIGCVVVGLGAIPLQAEDDSSVYAAFFQSLRLQERYERDVQTSPQVSPPDQLDQRLPPRSPPRPPRTVREKKREIKQTATPVAPPKRPPKPAEIPSNPHLALMTDPTLVPGDIVIFPDGPRVFQGTPGRSRHARSDFVPFTKAKGLTKSDRRYLAALRTGVNEAWVDATTDTKFARKTRDVETTGSISTSRKRR